MHPALLRCSSVTYRRGCRLRRASPAGRRGRDHRPTWPFAGPKSAAHEYCERQICEQLGKWKPLANIQAAFGEEVAIATLQSFPGYGLVAPMLAEWPRCAPTRDTKRETRDRAQQVATIRAASEG